MIKAAEAVIDARGSGMLLEHATPEARARIVDAVVALLRADLRPDPERTADRWPLPDAPTWNSAEAMARVKASLRPVGASRP
jgi:hypothetical protein